MGYTDTQPYGASDIRTPNLQRLANEGVRFSDAYTTASICASCDGRPMFRALKSRPFPSACSISRRHSSPRLDAPDRPQTPSTARICCRSYTGLSRSRNAPSSGGNPTEQREKRLAKAAGNISMTVTNCCSI
ncbi:MAG: sulfatase-like hydrolase/transferase [Bryobacterales bacterium]|nr:sulfatase-like hydrolase/transferase [Bryobacterales bacterium]